MAPSVAVAEADTNNQSVPVNRNVEKNAGAKNGKLILPGRLQLKTSSFAYFTMNSA
jgi:hypothetical protein